MNIPFFCWYASPPIFSVISYLNSLGDATLAWLPKPPFSTNGVKFKGCLAFSRALVFSLANFV
jgi:hypothetical protein